MARKAGFRLAFLRDAKKPPAFAGGVLDDLTPLFVVCAGLPAQMSPAHSSGSSAHSSAVIPVMMNSR